MGTVQPSAKYSGISLLESLRPVKSVKWVPKGAKGKINEQRGMTPAGKKSLFIQKNHGDSKENQRQMWTPWNILQNIMCNLLSTAASVCTVQKARTGWDASFTCYFGIWSTSFDRSKWKMQLPLWASWCITENDQTCWWDIPSHPQPDFNQNMTFRKKKKNTDQVYVAIGRFCFLWILRSWEHLITHWQMI